MSLKKKIIIGVIVIILIIGGVYSVRGRQTVVPIATESVTRGSVAQTVSVTGTLQSDTSISLSFETTGRIEVVMTRQGMSVAKGDALARIADVTLSAELEKARLALENARAQAGGNDNKIREAEVAVDNAERIKKDTENLEDQKVSAAEAAVVNAGDAEDVAKDFYDQTVTDSGASSATAKSAKVSYTNAVNAKKTAEENLSVTKKARDASETSVDNTERTARAALKTLKSSSTATVFDAAVATAQRNVDIATANLGKATLRAPVNGTITEFNFKAGEVLGATLTVAPVGRMVASDYVIEARVPESDITKVQSGMKAAVSFDALPSGESFDASVIEIDPAATVVQDVVSYVVKFRLDRVDIRVKEGMTANIDIVTARKDTVLLVPFRALTKENGKTFAQLKQVDGTQKKIEVTTGIEGDDGLTEILSGLKEGDVVALIARQQ